MLLTLAPIDQLAAAVATGSANRELVISVRAEECQKGALRAAEVHVLAGGRWRGPYPPKKNGQVVIKGLTRGAVTVQVIAPGCKTFGDRYQITDPREEITVRLEKAG
jgi:hypothetical protein